nr:MAG TPA: hypothetical protein [Caudoviricetes sp.]
MTLSKAHREYTETLFQILRPYFVDIPPTNIYAHLCI